MIGDPVLRAWCDDCGFEIILALPVTGRGWDERRAEEQLINGEGWIIEDGKTYCSCCAEKHKKVEDGDE
jgi:hypothetical protein